MDSDDEASIFSTSEHDIDVVTETSTPSPACCSSGKTRRPLPLDFQPTAYSVLCGRGKQNFDAIGNRRFRVFVEIYAVQYSQASNNKLHKSQIVNRIVDTIKSAGGGFIKHQQGRWWEISDHDAREKVGAMIRDFLHLKYKSAAKSKLARRKELRNNRKQRELDQQQDLL